MPKNEMRFRPFEFVISLPTPAGSGCIDICEILGASSSGRVAMLVHHLGYPARSIQSGAGPGFARGEAAVGERNHDDHYPDAGYCW
jgi:hypothetical protein